MDHWLAAALKTEDKVYLAVWRRGGEEACQIPLEKIVPDGCTAVVRLAYPAKALAENVEYEVLNMTCVSYEAEPCTNAADRDGRTRSILTVKYRKPVMARIFEVDMESI